MSKLEAKHEGFGRYNVLNADGEKVNTDWMTKETAAAMVSGDITPEKTPEETPERPQRNAGRRERRTFGKSRSRLALDPATKTRIEQLGLVERWVNDDGNRLQDKHACGYDFLSADGSEVIGDADGSYQAPVEGAHMREHVGTRRDGKPMYAYLMVTSKKNYEEDAAAKEDVNMQVDDAIRGGKATGAGPAPSQPNPSLGSVSVKNVEYKP